MDEQTENTPQLQQPEKKFELPMPDLTQEAVAAQVQINNELGPEELAKRVLELENAVSELTKSNQKLMELSERDPVTEQLNRRGLLDRAKSDLSHAKRSNEKFVVFLGDMNSFKKINDSYGHDAGDAVLKLTGEALSLSVRETDSVGRWGGDEWAG